MHDALTVTVTLAGLFFSLACALLLEELLFGLIFKSMGYSRRIVAAVQSKRLALQQGCGEEFPITQSQITKSPM